MGKYNMKRDISDDPNAQKRPKIFDMTSRSDRIMKFVYDQLMKNPYDAKNCEEALISCHLCLENDRNDVLANLIAALSWEGLEEDPIMQIFHFQKYLENGGAEYFSLHAKIAYAYSRVGKLDKSILHYQKSLSFASRAKDKFQSMY